MNENIKKQIKDAAKEYAKTKTECEYGYLLTSYNAFVSGANFILSKWKEAERWRRVEEELPEVTPENIDNQYLVKGHFQVDEFKGDVILLVAAINKDTYKDSKVVEFDVMYQFVPTHWKPIN